MSDAPERIWAWASGIQPPEGAFGLWSESDKWKQARGSEYVRADATFTADDLRRVFAIAIEMAGDTAKSIRLDYDVMKPDQITYEPMRVQRAAKGMVRIAEDDIRALTPPDDLPARVKEGRDG